MKLERMPNGRWHAYVFGPLGHWHLVATGATRSEAKANADETPERRAELANRKEDRCGR